MDFGDFFKLFLYILVPVVLSNSRKKKARKETGDKGEETSGRPVPRGGLLDRIEDMVSEMEKKAGGGYRRGPVRGPAKTVTSGPQAGSNDGMDSPRQTYRQTEYEGMGADMQWADRIQPHADRYAPAYEGKAGDRAQTAFAEQDTTSLGGEMLFDDPDNLIKGIILSEILQPPVTRRKNRWHSH